MSLNNFEAIAYINLDHREDRRDELLKSLESLEVNKNKIKRISGVFNPFNGHLGCVCSHLKVVDWAIEQDLDNVLILEDDCYFLDDTNFITQAVDYFFKIVPSWDIFMLGGYFEKIEKSKYPLINRVKKAYRAHSYAISKKYLPVIKKLYLETANLLNGYNTHFESRGHALDRRWHTLQKKDHWYANNIHLTGQKDGYSDIEWHEKKKR
ncbi:MAG: hypothetical protein K940chlam1_01273 [Candidatus Anoxychlamydiales bacterium]|nr:hypothetical protein [Candidatus Anoxychlamydiales bacterium]NGX35320.1 hypothetical protein [Candidatus Anoxychlamydiales bacterium]